jgi:hypothetical protein
MKQPIPPEEFAETVRIAEETQRALQAALDARIDGLDENAPDMSNRPKLLGMLVGVNAFVASFRGLEGALVDMLDAAGVPRANYERMVHSASILGEVQTMVLLREFQK